jgi:hypothetical protein
MASLNLPAFSAWHIPPLFIATTFTLGGLLPFFNPRRAMREFGLPESLASSPAAHTPFAVYGSRMTLLGMALWTFYLRGDLRAIDTIMSLLLVAGVADGYVCWKEGVPGQGIFRFLSSIALATWGLLGVTEARG